MKFNKSVFASFFLSYILLMAIIASVLFAFISENFSYRKAEIRTAHQNMLIRSCESISAKLDRACALLDEYSDEQHVNSLMLSSRYSDTRTKQNILLLHQMLHDRHFYQDIYDQITFRFGKLDLMLSNTGTCAPKIYYSLYMSNAFDSMEQWLGWTASLHSGSLYALKDGSIYMGTTLPRLGTSTRDCAIIMKLNEQNLFSSLLSAQDLLKGAIEVATMDGETIYRLGGDSIPASARAGSLYLYEIPDTQNRFVLKCAIEEETLFANVGASLRWYILVSLLTIVLGIAVSLLMSVRFYRPVKRITSMVGAERDNKNEFERIEKSIQSIIDERERLNSTLIHHKSDLIESEYRLAVSGESGEEQINELIARELHPKDEGLISIVLVGFEGRRKDVCNQLAGLLSQYTRASCFRIGQLVAAVAVACEPEMLKTRVKRVYEQLSAVCPGSLMMAVSDIIYTPAALAISHRQAMEALDYGMMVYGSGVIFSDEMPNASHEADSGITLYDHMRLQDAIRSSNSEEAKSTFRLIVNKYFPPCGVPLSLLKCRMFSLMNTLVASVSGMQAENSAELPVEKLLSCASVNDMIREAENYLETVCGIMQSEAPAQVPSTLCEQVTEYIKAHHQDPNMNVSSIADNFQLNASYLSRVYKQKTGEGLLDTIHFIRLAHVKQLLTQTDMPLADIQLHVGYPSEQTMFRAFKRLEGVTPSQYRQQNKVRKE